VTAQTSPTLIGYDASSSPDIARVEIIRNGRPVTLRGCSACAQLICDCGDAAWLGAPASDRFLYSLRPAAGGDEPLFHDAGVPAAEVVTR